MACSTVTERKSPTQTVTRYDKGNELCVRPHIRTQLHVKYTTLLHTAIANIMMMLNDVTRGR